MPTIHQPPRSPSTGSQSGSPSRRDSSRRESSWRGWSGQEISRRNFLKFLAAGYLGTLVPPGILLETGQKADIAARLEASSLLASSSADLPNPRQGRVASEKVLIYSEPSVNSPQVGEYWQDTVVSIQGYILGDPEPVHNRVWYRLGQDAYAHSGSIQPVETHPNEPSADIPTQGRLAEVTVPFTDAFWGPGQNFPHAYRFYYTTTHWVTALVTDSGGEPWYRLVDDKWEFTFYAPARHLRLVSADELSPISADLPLLAKRIEVNRPLQAVIAYEWNRPVFITRAATGAKFSNGDFSTPPGYHITNSKRPSRHMAAGNLAYNGYDLPGVPWVTYFVENGISFHGTYWHNNFGRPRSHGCVNLSPQAALWIYRWTLPIVPPDVQEMVETYGTPVIVV